LLAFVALAAVAAACASSGASFMPPTRPAEFSLAGVPWGIRPDSVTSLIEPRGYNYNRTDEDGDMWFDGTLFQTPTRLYAFIGADQLVKFRMVILTEDPDALPVYENVRTELTKRFGAPKETIERFQAPYKKGDNREMEAIRAGKATVETYWLAPSGRMSHVAVSVTNELVVVVDYDGPAWERESLRRRKVR
jgi:hypothetical protein